MRAPACVVAAGALSAAIAFAVAAQDVAIVPASEVAKLLSVSDDGPVALNVPATQTEIDRFGTMPRAQQCAVYFALRFIVERFPLAAAQPYLTAAASAIDGQGFSCGVGAGGAPAEAPATVGLAAQTAGIAVATDEPLSAAGVEIGD